LKFNQHFPTPPVHPIREARIACMPKMFNKLWLDRSPAPVDPSKKKPLPASRVRVFFCESVILRYALCVNVGF